MANILSKTGITTGQSVDAWHITQSIDAFTGDVDYDITVSGSFTLTGSLYMDGDMYGDTLGSSSTTDNSDYSDYSDVSNTSLVADFNQTDFFTLQLSQPETNLSSSTNYFIGMGEPGSGSKDIGLVLPIDCHILSANISATTQVLGSGENPVVKLVENGTISETLSGISLNYHQPYSSGTNDIGNNYPAGTRISIVIQTPTFNSSPQKVTHNVTLLILPYTV